MSSGVPEIAIQDKPPDVRLFAMQPADNVLQRGPRGDDTLRQQFATLIDSCVDFGTHVFSGLLEGDKVPPHRITAALMLREFLAHLDGASALLRAGSPESIKVALRSSFEAYLNLLYLLTADTERRSLCYVLAAKHQSIDFVERRDPQTKEGRKVADAIARDTSGFAVARSADGLPTVAELEAQLAVEPFAEVEKEWLQVKRVKRFPKWFELFGGPGSLLQLANGLGRAFLYDLLYREWSGIAHVESVLRKLEIQGPAAAAIPSLREANDLQTLTATAVSLALLCFKDVIDRSMPARLPRYLAWYSLEIQKGYTSLTSDHEFIRIEKVIRT